MRPAAQSTPHADTPHEQRRISISRTCARRSLGTLGPRSKQLPAPLRPCVGSAYLSIQRRAHYAEAVKAGIPIAPPGAGSYTIEIPQDPPPPGAYAMPPGAPNGPNSIDASSNEFRARFHRSLAAPTPFRTFAPASASAAEAQQQQQQQQQQATSTPNSVTSDPIDPHLSASSTVAQGTTTGAGKGNAKAAKSKWSMIVSQRRLLNDVSRF
jgi:hypothetical protein